LKEAPKTNALSIKSKKASSFHEFARSTSDAWDIGDDEDEDFLGAPVPSLTHTLPTPAPPPLPTPPPLDEKVDVAATNHTLQEHGWRWDQPKTDRSQSNGRVVKSQSEATLSTTTVSRKTANVMGVSVFVSVSLSLSVSVSFSLSVFADDTVPPVSPEGSTVRNPLQKQQSLPLRPIIPLVARISDQNASGAPPMTVREKSRLEKFRQLLASPNTDLEELRKHSWSGIPREVRPITWRLLSGYLPANMERRELVLRRKREEYFGFIEQYYDSRNDDNHRDTYRQGVQFNLCKPERTHVNICSSFQIHIDIPRTNPLIPLFQQASVQEVFERILFIWAIRHPASGYVQGINDLVTPFFVVFLSEFVEEDVENFDVAALPLDTQRNIEADSFWCMSKLLDGIQDNYTFAQPGIQIKVKALEELVSRIDEDIHNHFQKYEVEYLQFAFRWMNNLLMRELPLRCTIRLWDTYQAEAEGFSHFHLYVCAAFLIEWRKEILSMVDFQGLLMLLQNLPTIHWGNEEVGLLLAEAYRLKYMFADAPNHYRR
ncbi:TB22B protein, partial [Amia calva]|nr:TB22B protein [Amia calva]